MSLAPTSEPSEALQRHIQLTLSWPEADQLRVTLPWLLHALADRPTAPPQQRERRRKAHAALESLLSAVRSQLQLAEPARADE